MTADAVVQLDNAVGAAAREAWAVWQRAIPQESLVTENMKKSEQGKDAPAGPRKYYTLETDFTVANTSPLRHWVNQKEQNAGLRSNADLPFGGYRFSEPPQIRFDRKGRRGVLLDADPITLGIWLVSDRLKRLLERLDPEAFVFQQVKVDYSNFPEPGPDYWFCYIMRVLDCVDEGHSVLRYYDKVPGVKHYQALIDVKMRPEVVGSAHAFRLKHAGLKSIIDDVIVDALKAEKIRGFRFEPIQKN
jgi:hypothetical protein